MKRILALTAIALLASCGKVGDLKPAPGQALPIKSKMASTAPTAEQLLAPPPMARPQRVDELVGVDEPRKPDRFNLPPPDGGAAPAPESGNSATSNATEPGSAPPR